MKPWVRNFAGYMNQNYAAATNSCFDGIETK